MLVSELNDKGELKNREIKENFIKLCNFYSSSEMPLKALAYMQKQYPVLDCMSKHSNFLPLFAEQNGINSYRLEHTIANVWRRTLNFKKYILQLLETLRQENRDDHINIDIEPIKNLPGRKNNKLNSIQQFNYAITAQNISELFHTFLPTAKLVSPELIVACNDTVAIINISIALYIVNNGLFLNKMESRHFTQFFSDNAKNLKYRINGHTFLQPFNNTCLNLCFAQINKLVNYYLPEDSEYITIEFVKSYDFFTIYVYFLCASFETACSLYLLNKDPLHATSSKRGRKSLHERNNTVLETENDLCSTLTKLINEFREKTYPNLYLLGDEQDIIYDEDRNPANFIQNEMQKFYEMRAEESECENSDSDNDDEFLDGLIYCINELI